MERGKWFCVYKPHSAVNVRGFINPIRHLGFNVTFDDTKNKVMDCYTFLKKKETGPVPKFVASMGCFYKCKTRYGFHNVKHLGEAKSADEDVIAFYPDRLGAITEEGRYKPQQVSNMDETGLQ